MIKFRDYLNCSKKEDIAKCEFLKVFLTLIIVFFVVVLLFYLIFFSNIDFTGSRGGILLGVLEIIFLISIIFIYFYVEEKFHIIYYNLASLVLKLESINRSIVAFYRDALVFILLFYLLYIFYLYLNSFYFTNILSISIASLTIIGFSLGLLFFLFAKLSYELFKQIKWSLRYYIYLLFLVTGFIVFILSLEKLFIYLQLKNYYNYLLNFYIQLIIIIFLVFWVLLLYKSSLSENNQKMDIYNAYKKAYELLKSENIRDKNKKYEKYVEILKNLSRGTGNIGLLNDNPITLKQKDILGYKKYADDIYRIIKGFLGSSSLSIGILGEWGVGKSSIINLLTDYYLDDNPNYKILRFNPWDYDKNKLISAYFEELSKLLSLEDGSLRKQLKTYADYISKHINIPYIDIVSLLLNEGNDSLEAIKNNINKLLKDIDKKIIVIIDDLDRCMPDEIISMLNIIKNLGNFPNIIYLVSYDKKQIINVLENKNIDPLYLEKIINVERHIANPSPEKIKNFFENIIKLIFYKTYRKGETPRNIFTGLENDINFEKILLEFEVIFNKENLRFIKKLLNELNIVVWSYYNEIKALILDKMSVDEVIIDLITIIYVRLKYFSFYAFLVDIYYNGRDSTYTQEEIEKTTPNIYLSKYIRDPYIGNFCKKCLGIRVYENELKTKEYKSKYEFLL